MSAVNERVELPIEGMTCASCANRIERGLNSVDGVTATVNYATERATVEYDPAAVEPEQLVGAVESAGYSTQLPSAGQAADQVDADEDPTAPLRRRLVISGALSLPVLLMAMIPALQFDNWQWLSLNLATPVVLWGAWPFHTGDLGEPQARHGHHGHADLGRRAVRVAVVALRPLPRRRRDARHAHELRPHPAAGRRRRRDLSRDSLDRHHLRPRGPLLRGARQAARRRGHHVAPRARREGRGGDRLDRRRASRSGRGVAAGRPLRGSPRREGRHGRSGRGGLLGDRHEHAHGRVGARRGEPRIGGRGGHGECRWAACRARHEGRLRHRTGPDRSAGHRGADRQGAGAEARRSGVRRLRADRDRACRGHPWVLARHGGERDLRVHRCRGGAHHRLPLRTRARHADGAHGRYRPRRPAGPADQGAGGAGVDPDDRHGRARQDRHGHDGPHEPRRCDRRRGSRARRRPPACRGARARVRAPGGARDRDGGRGRVRRASRGRGVREPRGPGRGGDGRGRGRRGRPPGADGGVGL